MPFVTRKETFRVKPYAHLNYKFIVRAKLDGKWRRSYFKSEEEATAYARDQNAAASQQIDGGDRSSNVGQGDSPSKTLAGRAPNRRIAIPARTGARKAVVILGMHRSGTSALGGALELLGVNFGQRLAPPGKDNEKGYWEHPEIVALHDKLLRSLGSRWDDDKPLPSDWVKRKITRDVRSLLIEILERDFAHSALFGIKDPRMCRLMPLWFPIFQTLRVEPHFVLVVRHPWEVAESLAKRNGIEHPKSYLLWLEHVVQAEIATRNYERSFVRYEEMVDDPVAILGELRKQLGVNLRAPSRVRTSLRNFLDPSLRHHQLNKKKADKLRQPVPQLALDLYETIRNASTSREIGRKVEPLVAQFIRGRELFYPRIGLVEAELASLDNTPAQLSAQLLELSRVSDEKAKQVLHLQHEFEEKAKHVVLLQGELKEKSEQVVHFQHEFGEKSKHVGLLQGDLEKKSQQVAQFQEELEEKAKQVAQFKTEAEEGSRHAAQLQRVNEQQSQLLERLKNQLEISDDRLARAKDELLDARWEALTLRGTLVRRTESPKTSASRVLELESRVEAALSERDQLRTMLTSLQNDLEQERLMGQTKQGELRATQDQLKATQVQLNATQGQLKTMGKDLRSEQKQMDRLRESISRKLILPFGKSQRKLQQLTASRRADD
jgi:hypothetical protein